MGTEQWFSQESIRNSCQRDHSSSDSKFFMCHLWSCNEFKKKIKLLFKSWTKYKTLSFRWWAHQITDYEHSFICIWYYLFTFFFAYNVLKIRNSLYASILVSQHDDPSALQREPPKQLMTYCLRATLPFWFKQNFWVGLAGIFLGQFFIVLIVLSLDHKRPLA